MARRVKGKGEGEVSAFTRYLAILRHGHAHADARPPARSSCPHLVLLLAEGGVLDLVVELADPQHVLLRERSMVCESARVCKMAVEMW